MTSKADFNAEEWSTLTEAPALAGMRVVTAHRGGSIRESMAIAKVYAHLRDKPDVNPLLADITATPPSIDKQEMQQSGGDVRGISDAKIKEAVALLEAKGTPDELNAYRNFIVDVAEAAAKAHKEGGFIGIGGTEISPEEQVALDEITATLGE